MNRMRLGFALERLGDNSILIFRKLITSLHTAQLLRGDSLVIEISTKTVV
jgi:hypothetical protein